MKILAFLQNQWTVDPERMVDFYAQPGHDNLDWRAEMNRRLLFAGCLSGRRLSVAFGQEACCNIIWENASKRVGGVSSSVFPPDEQHIREVIEHHKPDFVVVFGLPHRKLIEQECARQFGKQWCEVNFWHFPHPAGRNVKSSQLRDWGDVLSSLTGNYKGEYGEM